MWRQHKYCLLFGRPGVGKVQSDSNVPPKADREDKDMTAWIPVTTSKEIWPGRGRSTWSPPLGIGNWCYKRTCVLYCQWLNRVQVDGFSEAEHHRLDTSSQWGGPAGVYISPSVTVMQGLAACLCHVDESQDCYHRWGRNFEECLSVVEVTIVCSGRIGAHWSGM